MNTLSRHDLRSFDLELKFEKDNWIVDFTMMMASAKLVRDCSSELSSEVRSLSVSSSTEEQESTTTESEYTEEEKEYELDDLQILKTIGK